MTLRSKRNVRAWVVAAVCLGLASTSAVAWDAAGHRTITLLAIDRLSGDPSFPAWLKESSARGMVAYQSGEPDRWRSTRTPSLKHENDPDHYIDLEDLEPFGLTLQTVPRLRYEYVKAMVLAKQAHPEKAKAYNPATDTARTQEYPGYLQHAIMEHYEKLRASFYNLRVLEALNDPARADAIAMAKGNIMTEMGLLSHFVGDAAQPLHTTQHHHGWIGENPKGYTTERGIHAMVDSAPGALGLDEAALKETSAELPKLEADPWPQVLGEIQRSFDKVEPLYELQKAGTLKADAGKAFFTERMTDASTMLAALYRQAWEASAVSPKDIEDFIKYDAAAKAAGK